MPLQEILALVMFGGVMAILMLGYPVAFSLAGTAVVFAVIGNLLDVFDWRIVGGMYNRIYGTMTNETLVAVPIFIFMGVMLERSKVAEALLETAGQLFGVIRGGLAISVVVVGAMLAAATGLVAATTITMAVISLPAMRKAQYRDTLATGVICASATLSQIIPPSTVLILMGDQLRGANAEAQTALGNFAYQPVTVTDLFAGALIPGLLLVAIFVVWLAVIAFLKPELCPVLPMPAGGRRQLYLKALRALVPPLFLIVAVLGSILSGLATPTESSAVGAVGAMILAASRRRFTWTLLHDVSLATVRITTMAFMILIGASFFTLVFRGLGGDQIASDILGSLPGGLVGATLVVLLLMFILGFFIDSFEIIFIVVPTFAPILIALGADPIWLGVMMGMILQTSYLTPPFGLSMFYVQGAFPDLKIATLYRGVMPFIALQLVALVVIWVFPDLALWLPRMLF